MPILRRQPSMADLAAGRRTEIKVEQDHKNPTTTAKSDRILGEIPVNRTAVKNTKRTYPRSVEIWRPIDTAPPTSLAQRSPTHASLQGSFTPPDRSPALPSADFGHPLSFLDVVAPQPFSHQAGSDSGSSLSSSSRRASGTIALPTHPSRKKIGTGKLRLRIRTRSAYSQSSRGNTPPVPPRDPARQREEVRSMVDDFRDANLGDPSGDDPATDGPASPVSIRFSVSTETSLYPDSSPSSGHGSLTLIEQAEICYLTRTLPNAVASEISMLTPSSGGLGLEPGSPASLPESLKAVALDITDVERRLSDVFEAHERDDASKDPLGPAAAASAGYTSEKARSVLLAQNTFYIPPIRPTPALRSAASLNPGVLRKAYTSLNTATSSKAPVGLMRSPLIIPTSNQGEFNDSKTVDHSPGGSTRRRSVIDLSLYSPPQAIEPLPRAVESPDDQPAELFRSSRPFLTANASLRRIFGREGFVARSLSGVFDQDMKSNTSRREGSNILKSAISDPFTHSQVGSVISKPRDGEGDKDKKWREEVLTQALALSISSKMTGLENASYRSTTPRMPKRTSGARLAIPERLLSAAPVDEMGRIKPHPVDRATPSTTVEHTNVTEPTPTPVISRSPPTPTNKTKEKRISSTTLPSRPSILSSSPSLFVPADSLRPSQSTVSTGNLIHLTKDQPMPVMVDGEDRSSITATLQSPSGPSKTAVASIIRRKSRLLNFFRREKDSSQAEPNDIRISGNHDTSHKSSAKDPLRHLKSLGIVRMDTSTTAQNRVSKIETQALPRPILDELALRDYELDSDGNLQDGQNEKIREWIGGVPRGGHDADMVWS